VVNDSAEIVADVIAGTTSVNGEIDVTGKGFRGGVRENSTSGAGSGIYDFKPNNASRGAEKGESIVRYQTEDDALDDRYGRGVAETMAFQKTPSHKKDRVRPHSLMNVETMLKTAMINTKKTEKSTSKLLGF
jgi:hypothetical protein